jgi:hypothetical protein
LSFLVLQLAIIIPVPLGWHLCTTQDRFCAWYGPLLIDQILTAAQSNSPVEFNPGLAFRRNRSRQHPSLPGKLLRAKRRDPLDILTK